MSDHFPEKPTCHEDEQHIVGWETDNWRPPWKSEPYEYPFRSCSYCGCIHPEDLLDWLEKGARLHGADWKYGWPHKYYVEGIPNPLAGQVVQIGSSYSGGHTRKRMGAAPTTTHAKWYNKHLTDKGYSPETLVRLVEQINKHLNHGLDYHGETWQIDSKLERGVYWRTGKVEEKNAG